MKYKALMLDLDGTTVPHFTNDVSQRVVLKIAQAQKYLHVCVITGRPLDLALPLLTALQITGPCAVSNGGQIYDPVSKRILRELFLVPQHLEAIYHEVSSITTEFKVFDGNHEYPAQQWQQLEKVVSFYVPDIPPEQVLHLAETMKKFSDTTTNRMLGTKPGVESIEIVNVNSTKQYGIYEVAKILELHTHEIIAVGDGHNDFAMLLAAGLKIAMGNAVQPLKDIADYIAPSVDEDGVAYIIDKFILSN